MAILLVPMCLSSLVALAMLADVLERRFSAVLVPARSPR